jgi:hypothetical protein
MSKALLAVALLCCTLTAGAVTAAQESRRLRPPRMYTEFGACPSECCMFRRWGVRADTVLYKGRSTRSPVAARARKGERVTGLTGVVVTVKPGIVRVKKEMTLGLDGRKVKARPGDVLYLLYYQGEGIYKFWLRGRVYAEEMPYQPRMDQLPEDEARARELIEFVSEPETVWWVKVRNRRGQVGWTPRNEHFDDIDGCG